MPEFKNFRLAEVETSASGLDAFLAQEPQIVSPYGQKVAKAQPQRVKVGSLNQLGGFARISSDTLVHKSTQDLWSIKKDGGEYYIERLFADNGQPLKG